MNRIYFATGVSLLLLCCVLSGCYDAEASQGHRIKRQARPGAPVFGGGGGGGASDIDVDCSPYSPWQNNCSVDLPGSNERFYVADAEEFECDTEGEITACAWIKPDSVAAGLKTIVSKVGSTDRTWFLGINGTQAELLVYDGATACNTVASNQYIFSTASSIAVDTWVHICGTWSYGGGGPARMKIYIDGVKDTGGAAAGDVRSLRNCSDEINIGSWGSSSYFDGQIDEVYVSCEYDATDIIAASVYNSGTPDDATGDFSDLRLHARSGDIDGDGATTLTNDVGTDLTGENVGSDDFVLDVP